MRKIKNKRVEWKYKKKILEKETNQPTKKALKKIQEEKKKQKMAKSIFKLKVCGAPVGHATGGEHETHSLMVV
jgi:hypothetical protein